MSLRVGRVAAAYPQDNSVDVVMVDDGSRLAGVQVMAWTASSATGEADLPAPAMPASGDQWSLTEGTALDMIAIVGFVGKLPVVLGFLYPQICQMLFAEAGLKVTRHVSDVYTTIDAAGNFEFAHPSGMYIRVGASTAHRDLTGQDVDGNWKITKNTSVVPHIHIEQAGGLAVLDIAPSGAVAITSAAGTTVTGPFNVIGAVIITGNQRVNGQIDATGSINAHVP